MNLLICGVFILLRAVPPLGEEEDYAFSLLIPGLSIRGFPVNDCGPPPVWLILLPYELLIVFAQDDPGALICLAPSFTLVLAYFLAA